MEGFFYRLFGKKKETTSASLAKARLSVIVAASSGANSEFVRELEDRVRQVVHEFYLEKKLNEEDIENLSYNLNDETGIMEVQIPLPNK